MKLVTKIWINYTLVAIGSFLITGYMIFYTVSSHIEEEMWEYFDIIEAQNVEKIKKGINPEEFDLPFQRIRRVNLTGPTPENSIIDTLLSEEQDHEDESFKLRTVYRRVNGALYRMEFLFEEEEYLDIRRVGLIGLFIAFVIIIISMGLMNMRLQRSIVSPLEHTLRLLSKFKVDSRDKLNFSETSIYEFSKLNLHLELLTEKVSSDYFNLKEFTENVSHEYQTPLAIIVSRIENILKEENLPNSVTKEIGFIYNNVLHLSKMSRGLNLMAKIDNSEFKAEPINFSETLRLKIDDIDELADSKGVEIVRDLNDNVKVEINPYLSEILISNLLSNSIKYCLSGSKVEVRLNDRYFTISNRSEYGELGRDNLFKRFSGRVDPNSLGLGLSIVKKICDISGFEIEYSYKDSRHSFRVKF